MDWLWSLLTYHKIDKCAPMHWNVAACALFSFSSVIYFMRRGTHFERQPHTLLLLIQMSQFMKWYWKFCNWLKWKGKEMSEHLNDFVFFCKWTTPCWIVTSSTHNIHTEWTCGCVCSGLGNLSFCLANRMVVPVTIFDANQKETKNNF